VTARVAVLASGSGSNLQAILDHCDTAADAAAVRVALVVSDRAAAGALGRARARAIPALHLPPGAPAGALRAALEAHGVTCVALAGYLRLVPADVVAHWRGRVVNVHPALLPAFGGAGMYGARVHAAVLAAGTAVSGPTVHFVDEEYDRGPIIAQWPVPVAVDDTVESLAARVLAAEHALYPRCVAAVATGAVRLAADGRVHGHAPLRWMP
jgi:formyltetrahydrofolate-dependent phosphoribosylglycinamide formyltransferase